MITITRSLVRQLRIISRRLGIKYPGHSYTHLVMQANPAGLTIRIMSSDSIIEYYRAGALPDEQLIVPLKFLSDCEGTKNDPITLEAHGEERVVATWTDRSIPQLIEYQAGNPENLPPVPDPPQALAENEPGLLQALADASQVADKESVRYALEYIQLRSSDGRVAATNGRQVFVQTGFQFPWPDDRLIRGSSLFGCRDLPQDQPVRVGWAETWTTIAVGPWTFRFCAPESGRFPKLEPIFDHAQPCVGRLQISPADAQFLIESLPRLPCSESHFEPITLDLNGQVMVRAQASADAVPTELIATQSRFEGNPLTVNTNRRFLVEALQLGFLEIGFKAPDVPAICIDDNRRYLWALLAPEGAIRPSDNAVRIESPIDAGSRRIPIHPIPRRTSTVSNSNTMNESTAPAEEKVTTTKGTIHRPKQDDHASPIEQVVVLRDKLRETVNQANELIRSLQRQKKQSRLVASTLASLKELQKVAG